VLRSLWTGRGVSADAVGGADDLSAFYPAAGEEDGLHRAPMIAAWFSIDVRELRNLGRAAEFARHDDERFIQQAAVTEVVEKGADCTIGGWKEFVFEVWEGFA